MTACAGSDNGLTPIRISLSSESFAQGLSMIAVDGGFFEANGLDVQLIPTAGATDSVTALVSGSVQAYTSAPQGAISLADETPTLMPLRSYAGVAFSLILSKNVVDESGLTEQSPIEDRLQVLNGLTIATISAGSSTTQFVREATDTAGVEVNETFLEQTTMVAALERGNIDGFVSSSPYGQIAVDDGLGVNWIDGPSGQWPGYNADYVGVVVGFTESYARANSEQAARILRSYLDASDFIEDRPNEAQDLLYERFNRVEEPIWEAMWSREGLTAFTNPIMDEAAVRVVYEDYVEALPPGTESVDIDIPRMLGADLVAQAQALP